MRTQSVKQAVIFCLVSDGDELPLSTLKRQVMEMLPFPVHAKEISDSVWQLSQSNTVKQETSSSGSLVIKLHQGLPPEPP